MDNKKPTISKAGKQNNSEENWFSRSEIAQMTGRARRKKIKAAKLQQKLKISSAKVAANAKKQLSKTSKAAVSSVEKRFNQYSQANKATQHQSTTRSVVNDFEVKRRTHQTNTPSKKRNYKKYLVALASGRRRLAITGFAVLLIGFVGWRAIIHDSNTEVLGEKSAAIAQDDQLPKEKPEFKLMYPAGTDTSIYDVRRTSPPEAAPAYTYLDRLTDDGVIFRVTQQQIPANFDIVKTANDFRATSIIQVDDITVYHGLNEADEVQSLIFEKNNYLVSIRSTQKLSDDQWAAYVASLK